MESKNLPTEKAWTKSAVGKQGVDKSISKLKNSSRACWRWFDEKVEKMEQPKPRPAMAYGEEGKCRSKNRALPLLISLNRLLKEIIDKETPSTLPIISREVAILDAQSEITPPPHTFWGRIADRTRQIFDPNLRDIRANQKFAAMSAETDETPADRKAAAQGEAMMKKAERDENVDEDAKAIKSSRAADVFTKIDDARKIVDKVISNRMYKKRAKVRH